MSRIILLLALVIASSGACTTMGGYAAPAGAAGAAAAGGMSVVLGLRPGDTTAYRRDLSMKSSMLQQFGSDLASAGPSASRSFRTWTAAGLVVGLAGGILGAVVKDKDDAAKAGAIGSALTGAISGWLGARKYETEAARASKCKESRESAMRLFQGVWTTDNVPATDAEVKEYQTAYTKGHESIRAACAQ